MLTKSRSTLATALTVAAIGAVPAPAIADWNVQGSPPHDGGQSAVSPSGSISDARGENAASQSQTSGAVAPDQRTADAREPFVRPVVVEIGDPAPGGFDWTAGIVGIAGGLAIAVLAGVGVAGARRRPVRPTVS
jgi:hypothetical protein